MIHCVLVWFLKPVLLSENAGTLNQQLEACRSMPQRAKIFLGTVGGLRVEPPGVGSHIRPHTPETWGQTGLC